ncbi:acyltransferase [Siphonobacter curvatus]|uniref:Acyltransferase n=1 Tax=Siphonobacter curvatus TaxID=2094562 RepID=A0A2S7IR79_9BACT|nr:acyltransferase [Siphonobacter curvatus]
MIELLKGSAAHFITIYQPINPDNTVFTFFTNLFLLNSIKWQGINNVSWNSPSWSISAEMCSYILYASVTLLLVRNRKNTLQTIIYAIILLSSLLVLLVVTQTASIVYTYNYGFLRGFIGFFTGVLCCKTYVYTYSFISSRSNIFFSWAETLVVLLVMISIYFQKQWLQLSIIYELIFFLTILIFSHERGFISHYLVQQPVLRKIALYSYSIYLTHGLINTLFNILFVRILKFDSSDYSYLFIANYILVFFVSSWSYHTIEKRFYKRTSAIT